jgi:hypothetical protein
MIPQNTFARTILQLNSDGTIGSLSNIEKPSVLALTQHS